MLVINRESLSSSCPNSCPNSQKHKELAKVGNNILALVGSSKKILILGMLEDFLPTAQDLIASISGYSRLRISQAFKWSSDKYSPACNLHAASVPNRK